ncbi:MAG: hypothetical protein IPH31_22800 [Lewinellaceae bacterium]|nr:hypothetical protein [Lewinellaceae bacterium]
MGQVKKGIYCFCPRLYGRDFQNGNCRRHSTGLEADGWVCVPFCPAPCGARFSERELSATPQQVWGPDGWVCAVFLPRSVWGEIFRTATEPPHRLQVLTHLQTVSENLPDDRQSSDWHITWRCRRNA